MSTAEYHLEYELRVACPAPPPSIPGVTRADTDRVASILTRGREEALRAGPRVRDPGVFRPTLARPRASYLV